MRRIYRTTTALVASLAIVTPQISLAQAEQQILPQAESPEQPANAEPAAPPAPEEQAEHDAQLSAPEAAASDAAPEQPAEATADEAPAAAPAKTTTEPAAAPEAEPAAEPVTEPAAPEAAAPEAAPEQPAPMEAQEPPAKPPVVQGASPAAKPDDAAEAAARTEKMAEEGKKQPVPKPAKADAEAATAEPAASAEAMPAETEALREKLEAKDEAQQPKTEASKAEAKAPAKKPAEAKQPKAETEAAPTGDQAGQDATEEAAGNESAAPEAATTEAKTTEAASTEATGDDSEEELRKKLEENQAADNAAGTAPDAAPVELPAPEAQAKPNAVAQRAAENVAPVTVAALQAEPGQETKGEVVEEVITQDNARSSAQEFTTAVTQGLQASQEQQASKDDDDDSGRDIAKLLLAGAAGFAVGKMLSNDRQVALNTGDRVVVTLPDGSQQVIKDENALLYRPGSNVQTETFQDGSTRSTVLREDGSRVVTIRDANMNILRRTLIRADGSETQLIDDTEAQPVRVSDLPPPPPVRTIRGPMSEDALREALRREAEIDRHFSLGQIRDIPEVRALVAPVNVPEITFDTGSAAITPDQARQLTTLGKVIRDSIARNPDEIYMIEGYTDAIGSNAANLALSDRRAESVALALTEYFEVPPENMVVQGYGEQFLLIPTDQAERENRRVAVRRITDLLAQRN